MRHGDGRGRLLHFYQPLIDSRICFHKTLAPNTHSHDVLIWGSTYTPAFFLRSPVKDLFKRSSYGRIIRRFCAAYARHCHRHIWLMCRASATHFYETLRYVSSSTYTHAWLPNKESGSCLERTRALQTHSLHSTNIRLSAEYDCTCSFVCWWCWDAFPFLGEALNSWETLYSSCTWLCFYFYFLSLFFTWLFVESSSFVRFWKFDGNKFASKLF